MGNLCLKKKGTETFETESDIEDNDTDANFANYVTDLPEIPYDPMVKEYLEGKHDFIDSMTTMGDSFIIPKVNLNEKTLQEFDSYNDMPALISPPLVHEYNNSKEESYVEQFKAGTPSTYGTRSPYNYNQRPPSFTSCICDPSQSINQDSDSMSRFSDTESTNKIQTVKSVEKNKFLYITPFDKKKWTWDKRAKIGPRMLPITPIVSKSNISPPVFDRLVQPT